MPSSRAAFVLLTLSMLTAPMRAADPVFDASRLHEVRLELAPGDWSALRARYQENTYYRTAITIDGERVPDCGIRSRGNGTRNGVKPSLKLDFNEYVSAQRFRSYKAVHLENLYGDLSGIHEHLSFSVFEAMGIPAPANAFARVYVNGEYWGLYELVEDVEDRFLKDRYPPGKGTLYKFEIGVAAWDLSWRGPDPSAYIPLTFEPKTNEKTYDPQPLVGLIRVVNEASDAEFLAEVGKYLDVPAYLTYLAVENAVAEVDGQSGVIGINNFYLYQLDGTARFAFIPWDKDFSFTTPGHDVFFGLERNRLVKRLLADPAGGSLYAAAVKDVVRRFANERWLLPRAEAAYALIRDSMREDTRKRGGDEPDLGNGAYEQAVQQVRDVLLGRAASVFRQLPGPWLLPSAASVSGAGGSRFTTDLVLHNPESGPVEARVSYRPRGSEGELPVKSVSLEAGETRVVSDVVGSFFASPDTFGPVAVDAGAAHLSVRAVTTTPGGGGTYGQSVPAFDAARLAGPGLPCLVAGVSDGPAVRSNLILTSASAGETLVDVALHGADGRSLGSTQVRLEAGRMAQLDRVAETLGGAPGDEGSLHLSTASDRGLFAAYVARIDAGTNDPRTLLPACAPAGAALVPASARVAGAAGSFFTTALVITNPAAEAATATVTFLSHDSPDDPPPAVDVPLAPGETRRVTDVLSTLFQLDTGYGALRITSSGLALVAGAETTTPAAGGGTYGQSVPAFPAADLVVAGAPAVLAGFRDDGRFRTNLILANASGAETVVGVALHDASGALLGETSLRLAPFAMTQVSRVGRLLSGGDVERGRLVVSTGVPLGAVAVYAAEIDGVTNDPRTILPR